MIVCFLLSGMIACAQDAPATFGKLSGPEKMWVIRHLFVANKARKVTNEALAASRAMKNDKEMDGDAGGGQVDAFRHAYWMALLSRVMCWKKAISLGEAHEKGNYKRYKKGLADEEGGRPDSVSGQMDLFNNKIGAIIGCSNKHLGTDSLKILVKKAVLEGRMKVILKNILGIPVDISGLPVNLSALDDYWRVPYILISSDKKTGK